MTGLASHIRFQRPDYSLSADRCTISIPGCLNLGSTHLPHSEEFYWDLTCLQADEVQVTDFSSRVPSASLSLGGKTHIQALPGTETSGTGHSVPFLAHLTSWSSTYAWEIPPHHLFPPGKKSKKECKATLISWEIIHTSTLICAVHTASLIPVCEPEAADTARAVMETVLH